jgi:hypothetical protein
MTEHTAIRVVGVGMERFGPAVTTPDEPTGSKPALGDGDERQ